MRCFLTHQAIAAGASPDEADVLDQVEAVGEALSASGWEIEALPCDLDLGALAARLREDRPDLVFNLVESLSGKGSLVHLVPGVLESLGVPFTGSGSEATFLSANKRLAKRWMQASGIPTPRPWTPGTRDGRFIVKSVWEHASIGLDAGSVVEAGDVPGTLADREARFGGEFLAEAYIEGREFNVAVLAGPAGPEVLPIAEIAFEDFAPGEPRIVDYKAKWDPDSPEYQRTCRVPPRESADHPLLVRVAELARKTWTAFGAGGYVRVDFRVDEAGNPWVLELNTNPCLSPDAGFAAALERAGIPYRDAVGRIVEAATAPGGAAEGWRTCPAS